MGKTRADEKLRAYDLLCVSYFIFHQPKVVLWFSYLVFSLLYLPLVPASK